MYLVFAYDDYYPSGGMDDLKLHTRDFNEVADFINKHLEEFVHNQMEDDSDACYDKHEAKTVDGNFYEHVQVYDTHTGELFKVKYEYHKSDWSLVTQQHKYLKPFKR